MTSDQEIFESGMELYNQSDYLGALPLLKQVADNGNLLAAEKVANCYKRSGDPESAVHYWEICRAAGNHSANTNYALYLKENTNQLDLAMKLWREASEAGIMQAAFNLGVWLKNLERVEEAKPLLEKAGDLGYLDGYFVLAGIHYYASEWDQAKKALEPLIAIDDPRAENLLREIEKREGANDLSDKNESHDDSSDFEWRTYDWSWNSQEDVRVFVDTILENHSTYEYVYDELKSSGGENFYTQWWGPVQEAIKEIALKFDKGDLEASIEHLLAPEGDYVECDPAIFDALLKYVPGFPSDYPQYSEAIAVFLDPEADYTSDWWDYSWYPFIGAEFTWTFWGPETLARSINIGPDYLTRIFLLSFNAGTPYKSFRARVALAINPNCPKEILDFLFTNRESNDWLINDEEEEGVLLFQGGKYSINEELDSISGLRDDAELVEGFRYPTDDMWSSGPGAEYIENLLDIEWEADSARTCLLAAFAKNPGLEEHQYQELAKVAHPLVRYFLSVNPSIPQNLRELLQAEKPTFTFTPYGSRYPEDITFGLSLN
jgi:tetratricopeptide (TPR) repeat protein